MSDTKQLDPPLTLQDFEGIDLVCDPLKLRGLIDGLRALPNVSDMAVIAAIAELDRIAMQFETIAYRRDRVMQTAKRIAREKMPQLLAIVESGGIPGEVLAEISREISPPSPTCDCEKCRAHFGKEPAAGTPKRHLNS